MLKLKSSGLLRGLTCLCLCVCVHMYVRALCAHVYLHAMYVWTGGVCIGTVYVYMCISAYSVHVSTYEVRVDTRACIMHAHVYPQVVYMCVHIHCTGVHVCAHVCVHILCVRVHIVPVSTSSVCIYMQCVCICLCAVRVHAGGIRSCWPRGKALAGPFRKALGAMGGVPWKWGGGRPEPLTAAPRPEPSHDEIRSGSLKADPQGLAPPQPRKAKPPPHDEVISPLGFGSDL